MQKSKRQITVGKRFFLIILCIVLVYVGYSLFMQFKELRRLQEKERLLTQELDGLIVERDKLDAVLDNLETPEFIESLIREKLGWVKKGETIYKENNE